MAVASLPLVQQPMGSLRLPCIGSTDGIEETLFSSLPPAHRAGCGRQRAATVKRSALPTNISQNVPKTYTVSTQRRLANQENGCDYQLLGRLAGSQGVDISIVGS